MLVVFYYFDPKYTLPNCVMSLNVYICICVRPFFCLDNVKMYKYAKFDQNIWCGSRATSIFTKKPWPAKMMLGTASPSVFILVAAQCSIT